LEAAFGIKCSKRKADLFTLDLIPDFLLANIISIVIVGS